MGLIFVGDFGPPTGPFTPSTRGASACGPPPSRASRSPAYAGSPHSPCRRARPPRGHMYSKSGHHAMYSKSGPYALPPPPPSTFRQAASTLASAFAKAKMWNACSGEITLRGVCGFHKVEGTHRMRGSICRHSPPSRHHRAHVLELLCVHICQVCAPQNIGIAGLNERYGFNVTAARAPSRPAQIGSRPPRASR